MAAYRSFVSLALGASFCGAALAQTAPAPAPAPSPAATPAPVPAAAARPPEDVAREAARKPAELAAFARTRPGMKVGDFIMGGGYLTRYLAEVVGPAGRVYAYQPAEFIQFRASYATDQDRTAAGRANVAPLRTGLAAVAFPEPLDAIVTVQNWHDLHLRMAPPGFAGTVAKRLFTALKPGGVLVVVDHAGPAGDTPFAAAETLHRGDAAATRAEIEAAGFRYDGESRAWALADDPKTASVFDPAIRGRTDQFAYRFVKP